MKAAKAFVLLMALSAISFSIAPLFAAEQEHQGTGGGSGGSSSWTVTCTYNQFEQLVSKSCTSGGTASCNCSN